MNAVIKEWMDKAEGDYRTAMREFAVPNNPNYDAACFHFHQCVEKLMKALLISLGIDPPRTHNLVQLHDLLIPSCPTWRGTVSDLRALTHLGGAFRYPGEFAERHDAERAFEFCERSRKAIFDVLRA